MTETEEQQGSNRERIQALEGHASKLANILDEVSTSLAELRMALNATSRDGEENRRTLEAMIGAMRRETNANLERLERRLAERHDAFGEGLGDDYEAESELEEERSFGTHNHRERRRHHQERGRDPYESQYGDYFHEARRGNRAYDRRPMRPKVEFPKFDGGDPYEWLDKADLYFRAYDIPREERVSTASYYLEGRASKWWRWLRHQYDEDQRRLGWTAFEKEFLIQFGPSPTINHHGQLAKLKQEGKVHHFIEEFRTLQTMVRGWSEEALIGTFIDGLKPWLAKEIKLKQPTRLHEVMRMAEILEESFKTERRQSKDVEGKVITTVQTEESWKGKEDMGSKFKPKPEIKKLSREEIEERIKKNLCFKCGEKWSVKHECTTGKAYMLLKDLVDQESIQETSSQETSHEEAEIAVMHDDWGDGEAYCLALSSPKETRHGN